MDCYCCVQVVFVQIEFYCYGKVLQYFVGVGVECVDVDYVFVFVYVDYFYQ